MDKSRSCKICNRTFSNGKAMGGHMRSHLAKLPPPQNPTGNSFVVVPPPSPSYSSSSSFEFPATPSSVQSSSQKSKRVRSKRKRKSVKDLSEQVSSITDDVFDVEDVAMSLVMLSRDKWIRMNKDDEEVVFDDYDSEDNCFVEEYEDYNFASKVKTKYKCLLCNKVFKSYQALGGHKASHGRMKKEEKFQKGSYFDEVENDITPEHKRIFKCPFCDKSFESGQALGGHKKIHFSCLDPISITTNYARSKCIRSTKDLLDLNLPAPEDDGEVMKA